MPSVSTAPRHKLVGICPPARGAVIDELVRSERAPVWLIVADELKTAEQLAEDIALFHEASGSKQPVEVLVFPESLPDSRDMREAFAASSDRLTVLSRLRASRKIGERPETVAGERETPPHSPSLVVTTTPAALLQSVPALEEFATREFKLARGQAQSFQGLLEKLRELDYDSEAVCEAPGHYAIRGGIIDVYPVTATEPYRLDFFGDEIEDIRAFDPVTQRSGQQVDSISLSATPRLQLDPSKTGIADYLSPRSHLVLVEPASLDEEFSTLAREGGDALRPILEKCAAIFGLGDLDEASALFDQPGAGRESTWDTESLVHHRSYPSDGLVAQERLQAEEDARHRFLRETMAWRKNRYQILFVVSKEGEEQRVREILETDPPFKAMKPAFLRGSLNEGFRISFNRRSQRSAETSEAVAGSDGESPPSASVLHWSSLAPNAAGLVVVTETEIFGRQRQRRAAGVKRAIAQRAQIDQLLDFSELVEGDFVVHLQHGIAVFRGLSKVDFAGGAREVISLEFDDHVTLHVPLQESHLISRYVGLSKAKPQLGRIGSGRWEKARQSAERATLDLAAELLRIQAAREAEQGESAGPDTTWQKEFEASFPFTETPDQLRAIQETKQDMERPRPMDRLICGDVGFGKTEVAIRAAFKAVQSGRQVALLVPTTVLAQQHLNTFRERMAGYPIAIEMLSRFRTRAEQTKIIAAAAAGEVDILIGTHRLLQSDVQFKQLGLVVIDEEQRFGVKHKEAFKRLRATVDVLSMSATPIPRTLYMALTGARDMSVIETAPRNRHPIQTIVKTYDEKVVVDAIRHEIRRGGQVFYLHNRVQTIDLVAARLRQLLPDLTVGVGHGQMVEKELERVMTEFVAGQHQVLVCTTIIESGLDIPNCNTIIIEGADRFGLSQLYQLRGRVGRFKHQAYAYLLLHRHTRMMEIARQRLNAMRTHNQLGAGFRIAMRDLELRGAGNLLGAEQSGHIVGVGFELYCQLLRQSVARLKGEKTAAAIRASVKLDFVFIGEGGESDSARRRYEDSYTAIKEAEDDENGVVEIPKIQARIPSPYLAETRLRIDFYRKLALVDSPAKLKEIESDLRDRFGPFGDEVRALLLVTEIRIRAEQKNLLSVETEATRLKCLRNSGRRDDLVMLGARFPRLTATKPLLRLREIISFINNLPNP
jgi:transcription-repair coupling factor (superfamily II helicase)